MTISRIDWLRVFPILNLWRAVSMGFRLSVLIPCILVPTGLLIGAGRSFTVWRFLGIGSSASCLESPEFPTVVNTIILVTARLVGGTSEGLASLFGTLLLATATTTFVGIAVARATATEFCQQSRTGVTASFVFAAQNFRKGMISLGLAVSIIALSLAAFWGIAKVPGLFSMNSIVVNLCYPFLILTSLLSIMTALVCATAWLLSLGAIGTDRCSGSDALSRGINYVLSHRLYTATIVGATIAISNISSTIVRNVLAMSMQMLDTTAQPILKSSTFSPSVPMADIWLHSLRVLPDAVQLGIFLASMTIGYILLRKAEDAVHVREMDGGKPQNTV